MLRQIGFSLYHPALEEQSRGRAVVLDGLDEFREHLGGELTLTLLRGIGSGIEVHQVNEAAMLTALSQLHTPPGG